MFEYMRREPKFNAFVIISEENKGKESPPPLGISCFWMNWTILDI